VFGTRKVRIEADLYVRARQATQEAGYASVRELVEHAVEKLLAELGKGEPEDRKVVEERLRGLGYIS